MKMYLAEILNSEIKDFNHLQKTVYYYDIRQKLEDRIHGDYHNGVGEIKKNINSVILELEARYTEIPENILFSLYKEICIKLEVLEEETYEGIYRGDRVNEIRNMKKYTIREFSEEYVNMLVQQYNELCEGFKRDAVELYKYKCDIVDMFNEMVSRKLLVS